MGASVVAGVLARLERAVEVHPDEPLRRFGRRAQDDLYSALLEQPDRPRAHAAGNNALDAALAQPLRQQAGLVRRRLRATDRRCSKASEKRLNSIPCIKRRRKRTKTSKNSGTMRSSSGLWAGEPRLRGPARRLAQRSFTIEVEEDT